MQLNDMSKEELEQMSYGQLTEQILKEGKPLNTLELFHKICELQELNEVDYTDKIGDYYTTIATDKRFILLPDGKWDLQTKHPATVYLDEEDLEDEEEIEIVEEVNEEIISDIDDMENTADIDDETDDDLTIISAEELDE